MASNVARNFVASLSSFDRKYSCEISADSTTSRENLDFITLHWIAVVISAIGTEYHLIFRGRTQIFEQKVMHLTTVASIMLLAQIGAMISE